MNTNDENKKFKRVEVFIAFRRGVLGEQAENDRRHDEEYEVFIAFRRGVLGELIRKAYDKEQRDLMSSLPFGEVC